jgi:hypothetical protein
MRSAKGSGAGVRRAARVFFCALPRRELPLLTLSGRTRLVDSPRSLACCAEQVLSQGLQLGELGLGERELGVLGLLVGADAHAHVEATSARRVGDARAPSPRSTATLTPPRLERASRPRSAATWINPSKSES